MIVRTAEEAKTWRAQLEKALPAFSNLTLRPLIAFAFCV